jgi:predicted ATPase/class 3 adenylate cyclase
VTFLFTDVVGSTALWERAPGLMREAVARHDAILHAVISSHDGYVFATGGDGVAAAFARAGDAVGAAIGVQAALLAEQWPDGLSMLVRMGLHSGEVDERDGDYFGPAVNRAARVMSVARGGQILMSAVTAGLVSPVAGMELRPVGSRRLRGVSDPIDLVVVVAAGVSLDDTAPPPDVVESNEVRAVLAIGPVTFGRQAELATVQELLNAERLVTVVGPGGVGKTHLALRLTEDFDGPVVVVPLSPVTDLNGALAALAHALDLRSTTGDLLDDCLRLLQREERTLVIDNCEHVLDAARDLVAALVAGCPRLRVLTTSRERLGLPVECVFRLAPLPVPPADGAGDVVAVSSVSLFIDRARRVRPDFAPGAGHLATIADIVRRLDGLPLAIELAAGRLAVLGVDDLAARLDRALDLLEGGRSAGESRHRTLRAAVEWSYELLDEAERRVFRHLSVFPDGFDLLTAESVAADVAPHLDPTRALGHLVDASMVTIVPQEPIRYRMLDTLRYFGLDCLAMSGELEAAQSRFTMWALSCSAWISDRFHTIDEQVADQRLRAEIGNLRAAWRTMVEAGDLDGATEIVEQLFLAAHQRELIGITSLAPELLALHEATVHPKRAVAYVLAAHKAIHSLDFIRAQRLLDLGSTLALDDRARSLRDYVQAALCMFRGEMAESERLMTGVVDHRVAFYAKPGTALAATYRGDLDRAAMLNRAYALTAPSLSAWNHYISGEIAGRQREWATAESHYRAAVDDAHAGGVSFVAGVATVGLLSAKVATGQYHEAITGYLDVLDHYERTGGWKYQWTTVQNIADMLDLLGESTVAAFLRDATSRPPIRSGSRDPGTPREGVIAETRRVLETLVSKVP